MVKLGAVVRITPVKDGKRGVSPERSGLIKTVRSKAQEMSDATMFGWAIEEGSVTELDFEAHS